MAKLVYTYSAPAAASMTSLAMAVTPLVDETAPERISGLTASRGAAYALGGGGIVLDLRGERATTDVTLRYTRHSGESSEAVEASVAVESPHYAKAWHAAEFYLPEIDPVTDDLVFEVPPDARIICCKADGFTGDDIVAAEPGLSGAPSDWGIWLEGNPATPGSGRYYGQGDDLALGFDLAILLMARLIRLKFSSAWLLFRRGDDFSAHDGWTLSLHERFGRSPLYPIFVGTYGTGDLPVWTSAAPRILKGANTVSSGGQIAGGCGIADWAKNCGRDNYRADLLGTPFKGGGIFSATGNSSTQRHAFMRRIMSSGSFEKVPPDGGTWTTPTQQRTSAFHPGKCGDVLHEKIFVAQSGSGMNYRADRSTDYDKPPEAQSHAIYCPAVVWGMVFREILSSNPSGSFMQFRSGGMLIDSFSWGHNSGYNMAAGFYDKFEMISTVESEKLGAGYTLVDRTWLGAAKFGGWWDGWNGYVAGGVDIRTIDTSFINCGAINSGAARIYADPTDIGPGMPSSWGGGGWYPININPADPEGTDGFFPEAAYWIHPKSNFAFSNYNRAVYGDGIFRDNDTTDPLPATAASQAERDATTVLAYAASVMGGTPTILEWETYLRGLDAPWEHAKIMSDQACAVMGHDPRATPVEGETLTFRPSTRFFTPGFMSMIPYDWDKGYLPGEAAHNDVVIPTRISWNHYAAHQPRDLTFGPGAALRMPSHCLRPTGTVTCDAGGNGLTLVRGAKFDIADKAGGVLDVSVSESRFTVTGDVDGIDLEVFYEGQAVIKEGASLSIGAGRRLALHGFGALAFDGAAGGTASLTLGGTLEFRPTSRIRVDGLVMNHIPVGASGPGTTITMDDMYWPKIGTTLTGANGAAVTAREWYQIDEANAYLVIDTPTGPLVDNEALEAADTEIGPYDAGAKPFGAVRDTPVWTLPTIGELRTGLSGYDAHFVPIAPNVVSTVTLGGTLHLDVTNIANGVYTLIAADSLSGAFAGVTAAGNAAKDLAIAIDTASTPKTVKVTVADGTGNIGGATA